MSWRVVVLGGSGFIGQAVTRECRSLGLDVFAPSSTEADLRSPATADGLRDSLDNETILFVTARARATVGVWSTFEDDIAMTATVGQLVAEHRLRKCVYFSSLAVYGDAVSNLAITEETPPAPSSPYGTARLAGERIVQQAAERSRTPLLVLRPSMVYGPGDRTPAYGPSSIARAAAQTGTISIFGDGKELRPYVFIDDAASISTRLAVGDWCGTFNLATGRSHSFEQVVGCLEHIADMKFTVVRQPRARAQTDLCVNPDKLREALDPCAFMDLERGLADTWRALQPAHPAIK